MPDIEELLERTTPAADDLAPLSDDDLDVLAQRAQQVRHRRTRRKRATVMGAGVVGIAAAAALVLGIAGRASDDGGGSGSVDVDLGPVGPNGDTLTEPVGSWTQAADPPFSARNRPFGGRLDDGRIVVWGGERSEPGVPADGLPSGYPVLTDGGVYDPATDSWESIPPAPLPPGKPPAPWPGAQLADDRLAVVLGESNGTIHAAVYDFDQRRWTVAPAQDALEIAADGMAWDGETLALVRANMRDDPSPGIDAAVTVRWRWGDDRWTTGAPAPLDGRLFSGSAFDGRRLALWGGTNDHLASSDHPGSEVNRTDGAIYDLATDQWTAIPDAPLPGGRDPAVVWMGERLVVGGGLDGRESSDGTLHAFVEVSAYDPATQTWSPPAAAPSDDGNDPPSAPYIYANGGSGGDQALLVADPIDGRNDTRHWFYGPDGEWEQAPLPSAQRLAAYWVVTSPSWDDPGDTPFSLQVRASAGDWLDSAPAPFDNRDRANTTLVTSGNLLMVVGGRQGADLEPTTEVWLFDLAG